MRARSFVVPTKSKKRYRRFDDLQLRRGRNTTMLRKLPLLALFEDRTQDLPLTRSCKDFGGVYLACD